MNGKNTVLFREEQRFNQWWLWLLILVPTCMMWYGAIQQLIFHKPFGTNPTSDTGVSILLVLFGILLPIFMNSLKLITEVRQDGLYVRFYPFHLSFRHYPYESINSYKVREYSPLKEYGGWGIRYGWKGKAYNVSGNRGVQLELKNGNYLLIGSQRPEELISQMQNAIKNNQ
ncbi:DUF6141 family protein [uncultured Methanomethylovorans sp.]|uniref:DUF6141 family protein n=1 Tax=uncultured Methanomethylovorans sp. TaxID=183759 RepID=UPI002AA697DE|nr:DUF6141 family protein [uncultured Methanomethylovorans sp.]